MFIIAKSKTGAEYLYSNATAILCKSEKQAKQLAEHLNANDGASVGMFKLKAGEIWHAHAIDFYDKTPPYRLKSLGKTGVKIAYNI